LSTGNGFGCQGPDVATFRLFCSEVPYIFVFGVLVDKLIKVRQ